MAPVLQDAVTARREGRSDDALRLMAELFDQMTKGVPGTNELLFITLFEWSQLAEAYHPAYEALASARDEQVRRLLDGDDIFGASDVAWPRSRFRVIINMNETLKDSRATYELFIQLLSLQPALAHREARLALPAIVEAGNFALAERYLADPLARLKELNQLANELPLFPPPRAAPRLAAELTIFVRDVNLLAAVHEGLGKDSEAKSLRGAALSGIASDDMRALGQRELAAPGTITREIRVVEEAAPLRQALLEMYVAIALDAKYNDFDNH